MLPVPLEDHGLCNQPESLIVLTTDTHEPEPAGGPNSPALSTEALPLPSWALGPPLSLSCIFSLFSVGLIQPLPWQGSDNIHELLGIFRDQVMCPSLHSAWGRTRIQASLVPDLCLSIGPPCSLWSDTPSLL